MVVGDGDGQLGMESMGCSRVPTVAAAIATSRSHPGQDLCLGGFIGALQGAFICASAVLKRNLYADMLWLKKRAQATSAKKQR